MGPACRGWTVVGGRPSFPSYCHKEEKARHGAVLFLPSGLSEISPLSSSAGLMRTAQVEQREAMDWGNIADLSINSLFSSSLSVQDQER